jgi:tRNA A37 threonylcarbamoyladenosine dehydratase
VIWQPVLYDAAAPERSHQPGDVRDTLLDQLRELVMIRNPDQRLTEPELDRRVQEHLDGRDPAHYGTWVYYPWNRCLVHVLPIDEFREVRCNRNQYKITPAEQQRLAAARIGVIGLSVGNMAAVTLALEGVGGAFRLADFDRLSLSNLNRLRGGVADLGLEKTVLAARELYEIDPWLDIDLHREGLRAEEVDVFLAGLDLVVEECDDLPAKVLVRERARALRIPVLMETNDRGLLDVERFDLEPARPIMHGLIGPVRAEDLRNLTPREKLPLVVSIVDGEQISVRMAASLIEVGTTIGSWPQLASGVALGAALVTDTARRILLGEHTESGRYHVDIAEIVADGRAALRSPIAAPAPSPPTDVPPAAEAEAVAVAADLGTIPWIAAMGAMAPSGHNNQPWLLRWREADAVLECRHDPSRDLPVLDFELGGTWVAFGALVENITIAARHRGLMARTKTWPDRADPRLVCTVELMPGERRTDPLLAQVPHRVTNRRHGTGAPLPDEVASALLEACGDARLKLLRTPSGLAQMGALAGAGDRIAYLDPNLHREVTQDLLWTPAEVRAHPAGLDVATLELDPTDRAALRLAGRWRVMEALGAIGGGRALEDRSRGLIASASAVGLVTVPGTDRNAYFTAGRAIQRMWLTATALGVAIQPMTTLPYLLARAGRGAGDRLTERSLSELARIRPSFDRLVDTPSDHAETLLFRIFFADPPTARSLRRPLTDVLTVV